MGIYDREYVRLGPRSQSGLGALRLISVNSWIIILNCVVFGIAAILPRVGQALYEYGHFSTYEGMVHLQVWRLVTYQFLHANITHLFFNMFGLWVFGGMVEGYLGSKRYAAFYLTCGVFGGVSYLLLNFLGSGLGLNLPGVLIQDPRTPLIGASAGVFGVIMACAYIAPNAIVQLIFPPIPLKLSYMAYGYVGIAAVNLLWNSRSGANNAGGDAAHLGGAAAGWFFIRNAHLLRDFFDVLGDSRRASPRAPRAGSPEDIERILKKVSLSGLASLTEGEKAVLRRASTTARRAR